MKASPQPTVVPVTGDRLDRDERSARPPVDDQHAPRTERDDEPFAEVATTAQRGHRRIVWLAWPADDREVDPAHRVREAIDGVVPEAEEVGDDLEVREPAGLAEPLQLGDHAVDEDGMEPLRALERQFLVGGEPEVGADARHVVVHPRLAVGQDLDVDRSRRTLANDRDAAVVDAVPLEYVQEQRASRRRCG